MIRFGMADAPITIRALHTLDEYHQAEAAQRELWELRDDVQIVPLHVLLTAQKNGGLVAGAFQSEAEHDTMVGFLFGFLGVTPGGTLKHCSHLLCVHPHLRRSGIGEALKRFQFDFVKAQGKAHLIGWTFDPLEGVNAMLNIGKLRGVVRSYSRDIYGLMNDGLNAGLPSDRLNVEWWLSRPDLLNIPSIRPTRTGLIDSGAMVVNGAMLSGESRTAGDDVIPWDRLPDTVLVEIPADMQAIKRASLNRAMAWRLSVRSTLESLFGRGYTIADFIHERAEPKSDESDRPVAHNFYVLRQGIELPPL